MSVFDWSSPPAEPPRALEALAAQRQAELWDTSLSLLERGKAEDAAGNWRAAYILIAEGVDGLLALSDVTKREDVLNSYETIVSQYQKRLQDLRSLMTVANSMETSGLGATSAADSIQEDTRQPVDVSDAAIATTPTAISAPAAAPGATAAATSAAQARMCVELAVSADESGEVSAEETVKLYTAAAECYFAALKEEAAEATRAQYRGTLASILERAEMLRGVARTSPVLATAAPAAPAADAAAAPAAAVQVTARTGEPAANLRSGAPRPSQMLGDVEKEVLARSSTISGCVYYPYLGDGQRERFHFDVPWEDPDGLLPLSAKQKSYLARWCRPSEFIKGEPKMIHLVSSMSITQTIITDCSFVSSLVIAAAYERRQGKQLITNIIYPQDRKGLPIYNPAGKYLVRLHINGIERKVVVDDRLPLARDGRLMTSHTTHPQELWVAIIEKAFMKVHGGYDFPGSNSGIDLNMLTGWIPEQFRTDDDDFEPRRLWERMVSAASYGDCLLTVATGELKELDGREEEKVGLVSTHAYAVLQVREVLGQRLIQLKNPWSYLRWKGAYSVGDAQRWTPELRKALNYDVNTAMQHDNGVFWIDYPSLLRYFQGVYLNWNPQLFAHNTTHHGQWPAKTSRLGAGGQVLPDSANLGRNPQYGLTVNVPPGKPAAVWLLLSRHTTRKNQGKDDFLTVHVFRKRGGFRVYYLEECWKMGVYSNRPHCLVQFDLPPGTHKLTLALAQYSNVPHQVDYTLRVYSMAAFTLRKLPFTMKEVQRIGGEWRGPSAGGCANYDTVIDNPSFVLSTDQPADVCVELSGSTEKHSVGLELSPLPGAMGDALLTRMGFRRDPIATSGNYRSGFCILEKAALSAGKWVVTAATFEPRQEGPFALTVSSSQPLTISALPHEGHGLQRQIYRSEWSAVAGTAAGSSNHKNYHRNPQVLLTLSRRSEVLLRLRCNSQGAPLSESRPYLALDVYGPRTTPIEPLEAESGRAQPKLQSGGGKYAYPPGGTLVPRSRLEAGSYVLVLSTFDPVNCGFELIVYADDGAKLKRL